MLVCCYGCVTGGHLLIKWCRRLVIVFTCGKSLLNCDSSCSGVWYSSSSVSFPGVLFQSSGGLRVCFVLWFLCHYKLSWQCGIGWIWKYCTLWINFIADQEFSMEHCCEMKCALFTFNLCTLMIIDDLRIWLRRTSDGKQLIIISSVAVESEFIDSPCVRAARLMITYPCLYFRIHSEYPKNGFLSRKFSFGAYGNCIFCRILTF